MKIINRGILIFSIFICALMMLSCSANSPSMAPSPNNLGQKPLPAPPPRNPKPIDSIPPDERAFTYYFVDTGRLSELGMRLPREIISKEKDKITQIGLDCEPVKEMITKGYTHRVELALVTYYSKASTTDTGWGYGRYNPDELYSQANPYVTWFAAARIGIGTPQQFDFYVAVDSNIEKAVYAIRFPDKRVAAPPYVQYLTEEQKNRLVAIASEKYTLSEPVEFQWVALSKEGSSFSMEYDIVEKGIQQYLYNDLNSLSMTIYPSVAFKSVGWFYSIAIDLKTGKIVYYFQHPLRNEPVPAG